MLPTKFRFIWQSSFRGEDFKKSTNQKQELSMAAMFVNGSKKMSNTHRGPFMDDSYQVSVHLFKQFQRIRFLEIDQELPMVAMFVNGSGRN